MSSASKVGIGDDRDVEGAQQRLDARHLRAHVVGHGVACRLVRGKLGVAPGVAGVEGDGDIVRLHVAQRGEQLARKAVDGAGRLAVAC
jgi:hypothetical protein